MALPPPPMAAPVAPMGAPLAPPAPVAPPPPAAPTVPWKVKQQPDGSSVDYVPSPDGDASKDIVLAVHLPPKLPRAMQAPQQPQPGQ